MSTTPGNDEKKDKPTMKPEVSDKGRRNFIKYAGAGVAGFAVATVIEYPLLNNTIQQDQHQIDQLNTQVTQLNTQSQQLQGEVSDLMRQKAFLTLNPVERPLVEVIAETIIPTDASGPGAKEAGVIYFIDRMLAGTYGKNGNMYMQGPFIKPQTGPLTVDGITYTGGTITPRLQAGTAYQYPFSLREYWRRGLVYLQEYSNSAYGGNFETLSLDNRTQILKDLFNNKPTNFVAPTPAEFFNELHDMVTAGFWSDPIYGGNQGMVGWKLLGFAGSSNGAYTFEQLMVMDKPVRIDPPTSISDIQGGGQH
jgi:gluconate 2-dehydrogenase gamma chain